MAEKSVLELLANAPRSELRKLPMSLPAQAGNPANLAGLQAAKASTDIRRNVARERLALNRYLATGDKAKALGFTPQMSMQLGGQQSAPVSPMFEPGADVGAMTAALRNQPILNPVQPEQQLTAADRGTLYGPGYEGRYYQPGNVGAGENLAALQSPPQGTDEALLQQYPGLMTAALESTLPASVQRAGIQTELLPPPPRQEALLEPVVPSLEPPSDVVGPLPMFDQSGIGFEPLSPFPEQQTAASASPGVPELLDRRQLMAENLPPDIAFPEERVTPEAPAAAPITPVSTATVPTPAEQEARAATNKTSAGIVNPQISFTTADLNNPELAAANEFLGEQATKRIRDLTPDYDASKGNYGPRLASVRPTPSGQTTTKSVLQPPVKTSSKTVSQIDKMIQTELASLTKEAPKDSTMPFWNWLSDFSAGLRAAGKSGDQSLGAIADGFANVRAKAKERAATRLATRKISIENIKNLGEVREDIITADRQGGLGASATALFGSYLKPGEILGPNGVVPRGFLGRLGYDYRTTGTYSTTKAGRVMIDYHTQDPAKDKKVRFYPINKKTKLPTHQGSLLISPMDPKFMDYSRNSEYTQTGPSETADVLSTSEMKTMFKDRPEYLNRLLETGASVKIQRNSDGSVKNYMIEESKPMQVTGYYDAEKRVFLPADKNNPTHMKDVLRRGMVPITVQTDTPGKGQKVNIVNKINSARQGIEIINRLKEIRANQGGASILGSISKAKIAGGTFAEIIAQAGREFLPFYSFGQELAFDQANNMVDENVIRWLNRDLSEARVLESSLIYKYAKIIQKGTGRLNTDDIDRAVVALGKKGFLQVDADIFARYEAVLPLFQQTIEQQQSQLKEVKKASRPIGAGPAIQNVSGIVSAFAEDDRFTNAPQAVGIERLLANPSPAEIRLFNQYHGEGTAELIIQRAGQ
tara:strand:+ start:4390 stop:7179 length:2790 start_codon:yes stop_codon:yes gene_type:complete